MPQYLIVPPAFILESLKALGERTIWTSSFDNVLFPSTAEQFPLLWWQFCPFWCPFCQSFSICRGDYNLWPGARMLRKRKDSIRWPAWWVSNMNSASILWGFYYRILQAFYYKESPVFLWISFWLFWFMWRVCQSQDALTMEGGRLVFFV